MALPNFMWRRAATREPVHAPVPEKFGFQAPESEFFNLSLVFIGFLPDQNSKLSKSGNAFHDIQDFFNEQQDEWNREQISNHADGNGPQDRNI